METMLRQNTKPLMLQHASLILASALWLTTSGMLFGQQVPETSNATSSAEQAPLTLNQPVPLPRSAVAPILDEISPLPASRLQMELPDELVLPEPSEAIRRKVKRFVPSAIDPELPLRLVEGRPKILQLAETPVRIYTPTDTIIRTEIIDERSGKEIAVTGLKTGTTTLILWFDDETQASGQNHVAYEVVVRPDPIKNRPIDLVEKDINQKFPNSFVELAQIEGRVIVRGQAPDAIEMSQILSVVASARGFRTPFAGGSTGQTGIEANTTVNLASFDELSQQDRASARRREIDQGVLNAAGIINQMKVIGEQQVMLKVTVAEVNRSAARSIGLNFGIENNDGLTVFQSLTGGLGQASGVGASQGSANVLASLDMGQVSLAIEALRQMNLSRTLAEPNLVAMNGQSADFQAGGQFPIPVISSGGVGNNLQGVSFVPFGVQLEFTPFIQDRDVIRLRMNAEVSTRDESLGTSIGGGGGGTQVSGLNSRNFSTTVQLRSGQTIAVAGLLQSNFGASTERIPFWGDLPMIGATGGVNRTSSGEQELVILVTPHLVAPVDACETPALPGSDVHEPTDLEFYVANRLESRRSKDYRASVRTDHARQKRGEDCCVDQFMIGEIGPTDRCCPRQTPVPHRSVPTSQGMQAPTVLSSGGSVEGNSVSTATLSDMIQRGDHE
ncbi:MAG: type II and III secretion system protein family protein [Rubripirellula sp.]